MSPEDLILEVTQTSRPNDFLSAPRPQELITPLGALRSHLAVTCPAITTFVPMNAVSIFLFMVVVLP